MSGLAFCMHRVTPHYPVLGDWTAFTPWEIVDGRYQRLFRSRSNRGHCRKAFIERRDGGWRWRVIGVNSAGTITEVGSGDRTYTLAYNAFNPAETSAKTK